MAWCALAFDGLEEAWGCLMLCDWLVDCTTARRRLSLAEDRCACVRREEAVDAVVWNTKIMNECECKCLDTQSSLRRVQVAAK
jgi:hypothetical protein